MSTSPFRRSSSLPPVGGVVVLVLVLSLSIVGPAVARSGEVVVAPWGDDAANGTAADPLGSLDAAFSMVQPGGRVVIRGGTFEEDVVVDVDAGPNDAAVVVTAWPGEHPVLRGRLWLRRPSNWHVSGLEITWRDGLDPDMHLVKVTGGTGWTLADVFIHDARSYAAVLVAGMSDHPAEPADWAIRDSCIRDTHPTNDTNQDHLIYVNSGLGSGAGRITNNVLIGAPNGTGVKLGGPSPTSGGASGVAVSGNTIADVKQGVLIAGSSHGNRVEGNRFGPIADPYAAVRSFRLDNDSNVASDNTTFGAPLLLHYDSPGGQVRDGGHNERQGVEAWQPPSCGARDSAEPSRVVRSAPNRR